MEIWFLSVHARPAKDHARVEEYRGAYINCWVKASSAAEAQQIAFAEINNQRWIVEEIEHLPETSFERTEGSAGYLTQAQLDGECYVYHTYSFDEDADQVH